MDDKYTIRCAVYPLIARDGKVLMIRRKNTGWKDGEYAIPGGHLEKDETILQAVCREAKEEVGLKIGENQLEFIHAMHRKSNYPYLDIFFKVRSWEGEPFLGEEEKSDDLIWAYINNLPENTIEYIKQVIEKWQNNILFSQFDHE
jgi:ADP-ribose pyrophosphatase YjhB (NUDIX family)